MRQILLFAAVSFIAATLNLPAQNRTAISLPANGSTPVVVMDYRGGFGPTRMNQAPVLTILADGSSTVTDPTGERPTRKYTLSRAEVQDLLRDIVQEQDFFNIDHAAISRAMAQEDRRTGISTSLFDDSTTVIRVKTGDREKELSFYGLGFWANRYLTIRPLQRLLNVEKRLERQIEEFKPGVRERIALALSAANDTLKREHPRQRQLTLNDFFSTGEASGTQSTQFSRIHADRSTLLATVTRSPGMASEVTIEIEPESRLCLADGKTCVAW